LKAFVYMLRCGDGSLYTGWTNDLEKRLKSHSSGKGAKYTRGRGPFEMVWHEELPDMSTALRREVEIKALTRSQKEEFLKVQLKIQHEGE
jgi:Predicted endonuclease containing a URI domain